MEIQTGAMTGLGYVKLLSLLLHECKGYKESTKGKYSRLTFKKGGLMVDGLFG